MRETHFMGPLCETGSVPGPYLKELHPVHTHTYSLCPVKKHTYFYVYVAVIHLLLIVR